MHLMVQLKPLGCLGFEISENRPRAGQVKRRAHPITATARSSFRSSFIQLLCAPMAAHDVKLLSALASMFGLRVFTTLKEKGIAFEYLEQDLQNKSQLLLDSNPIHKKIPVMIHNGKPVCESLIIVQYLDEVWPAKPLLPADPYDRAQARFWADFVDKKVYDGGVRIVTSPEGELQEQAKQDLAETFITLDKALGELSGGSPFYGGDRIGLVDVVLASYYSWLKAFEEIGSFTLPDEKECPRLNSWLKAVAEYPSVKETIAFAPPHKILEFAMVLRNRTLGPK